jgi:hypothetical protein
VSKRKFKRELAEIAAEYGFDFDSVTGKGHYRWRHRRTGKFVHTISHLGEFHGYDLTRQEFRRRAAQFEECGQ